MKAEAFWHGCLNLVSWVLADDGESREEVLQDLYDNKKSRFAQYITEGLEIPEPGPS